MFIPSLGLVLLLVILWFNPWLPMLIIMWFGCPQSNAMGGCDDWTVENALPRIVVGISILVIGYFFIKAFRN